jgi:hypothetical protein
MFAAAGRFELRLSGHSFPGYRSPVDEHGGGSQGQAPGDDSRAARRLINQWLNDIPLGYAAQQGQPEVLGGRQRFILCLAIETGALSASTPVTMAEYIRQGHQSELVPRIWGAVQSEERLQSACYNAKVRSTMPSEPQLEGYSNVAGAFESFCRALAPHLSCLHSTRSALDASSPNPGVHPDRAKAQQRRIIQDIKDVLLTYYDMAELSEELTGAVDTFALIAVRELSSRERRDVPRGTTEILESLIHNNPNLQDAFESLARHFNPVFQEGSRPPGWGKARDDAERRALLLDAAESEMRQRLLGVLDRQFPESSQDKRTQPPGLKALLSELASVGVFQRTTS